MILGFVAGCDEGTPSTGGGGTGGVTAGGGGTGTGGGSTTGGASSGGASSGGSSSGGSGTGGSAGGCLTTDGTGTFTRNLEDGRLETGTASGYAFAYISPSSTATAIDCGVLGDTATAICASGTVPAQEAYEAVAGIGVNVNQEGGEGTTPAAYAGTVTGITVNYENKTPSELRVQVGTSGGDFCYKLTNTMMSATLTPADFNSACWDGTGDAWDGTGLESIQLITPSKNTATTPFSACLNGFTITP